MMMVDNCLGVKDHLVPGSSHLIGKFGILSHSDGKIRIKSTKLHKCFYFVCRPIGMKYRTGVKLRSTLHEMNLQDLRVGNVLFYKMFQPFDNTPA